MIPSQGSLTIGSSLLDQAKENDSNAIEIMFRQFLPEDEKIYYVQYLGLKGLWGIGTHEFAFSKLNFEHFSHGFSFG